MCSSDLCAAFSTARAWRPAAVARLARTLGLTNNPMRTLLATASSALLLVSLSTTAAAQTQDDVQRANMDWAARRPLPDLPDLSKPVYIIEGVFVCESPGALRNPNKDVLLVIGSCTMTQKRMRVSVFPPRTHEQYVDSHVFRMVRIAWRSLEQSDATVYTGWTVTLGLQN